MATKAIDIITPALRKIGVIGATETPSARQIALALACLNDEIIDPWSVLPFTATKPLETTVTLPANTPFLTVGPGQAINIPRPARIVSAYARVSGLDQTVDVATKQMYDAADQKTLGTTWPQMCWYDQGLPTGKVYFWPLADSSIEVHLTTSSALSAFADSNAAQDLPGGFKGTLILTLAVAIAPAFQLEVPPSVAAAQATAYAAMTAQNVEIPELDLGEPAMQTRKGQFISGGY
jgi:hypothetical protein